MQGDEDYKFEWTSRYRRNIDVKWVNNKLSSHILDAGLEIARKMNASSILLKCIKILLGIRNLFNSLWPPSISESLK